MPSSALLGCYLLTDPAGALPEAERRWACLQEGQATFLTEVRQELDSGPVVTCRQTVVVQAEESAGGWRLSGLIARARVELPQASTEIQCAAESPAGTLSFQAEESGAWRVKVGEAPEQLWVPVRAEEVGRW